MKRLFIAIAAICSFVVPSYALNTTTPINITESTTATTGTLTTAFPAVSGRTNYICGFVITSGGTTSALVVNATVTGTITGTLNFQYVFPSSGQGVLGVAFPQCIIASASNSAITVSVPGGGTGTNAALSIWGYKL